MRQEQLDKRETVLERNADYSVHVNKDQNQILNFLLHTDHLHDQSSLLDKSESNIFGQQLNLDPNSNKLFPFSYLPPAPVAQTKVPSHVKD